MGGVPGSPLGYAHRPAEVYVPSCVFAEAVSVVVRRRVAAVSSELSLLLVDRVLLASTSLHDADEGDDEQKERDDAHHADEPARRSLQRLLPHRYTHARQPAT